MKTRRICLRATMGCLAALGLAGCSMSSFIPEAKPDPTRFFVLSTPAAAARAERTANAPTVRVRLELASYARARSLIVRRGDNELEFRDFARWGEALEQGIARVLREELLARGASAVMLGSARGAEAEVRPNYEITVRVLACEGQADGGVNFRAVWQLEQADVSNRTEATNAAAVRHDFRASGLRWDGRDEATLAARLSEAVSALAVDIARAWAQ